MKQVISLDRLRRAKVWYEKPITVKITLSFKKSSLIILTLILVILYLMTHHKVAALTLPVTIKKTPTNIESEAKSPLTNLFNRGSLSFSEAPIKAVEAARKAEAERKAAVKRKAQEKAQKALEKQREAEASRNAVAQVDRAPVVYHAPVTYPNNYPLYQCTWYAKSRRPDIPNNLGDAMYWFAELAAQGWSVGYSPKAGAIGESLVGNHVVYIEYVNSNGSVHLSERNYDYKGSFRERDAPAGNFEYIY